MPGQYDDELCARLVLIAIAWRLQISATRLSMPVIRVDPYFCTLTAMITTIQGERLLHDTLCLVKHLEIRIRRGHFEQYFCCLILSIGLIQRMLGLSGQIECEPVSLCIEGTMNGERLLRECLCSSAFALVWLVSLVFAVLLGVHFTLGGENTSKCHLTVRRAPMRNHRVAQAVKRIFKRLQCSALPVAPQTVEVAQICV